jgi:hypothetical protein
MYDSSDSDSDNENEVVAEAQFEQEQEQAEDGVNYRRSGGVGNAASTVAAKQQALERFEEFLVTKRLPVFDSLTEAQLCSKVLWQEYGTYLSEHARNRKKVSTA